MLPTAISRVASASRALSSAWLAERAGESLCGLRVFGVDATPPAWLTDGRADPVWKLAGELGITIVPTVMAGSLPSLAGLLERHPDVPIVVEHIGFVDLTGGTPFPLAQPLFDLARYPQLSLKVTTHGMAHAEAGGDAADLVDRLVHVFGAHRLAWGSDYPQALEFDYAQMLALARRATRRLAPADRDLFFGGTALNLWWPQDRTGAAGKSA